MKTAWRFESVSLIPVQGHGGCCSVFQEMSGERQECSWTGHHANIALDSIYIYKYSK